MKRPTKPKAVIKKRKSSFKTPVSKKATPATSASVAKSATKQDVIVNLLRKSAGATLASLVEATGWQPHSVRGFLAGTVRKKLSLELTSEKVDGVRVTASRPDDGSGPERKRNATIRRGSGKH